MKCSVPKVGKSQTLHPRSDETRNFRSFYQLDVGILGAVRLINCGYCQGEERTLLTSATPQTTPWGLHAETHIEIRKTLGKRSHLGRTHWRRFGRRGVTIGRTSTTPLTTAMLQAISSACSGWAGNFTPGSVEPFRSLVRRRFLSTINPNRNFTTSRAEFLIKTPICTNPKIILGYLHLKRSTRKDSLEIHSSSTIFGKVIFKNFLSWRIY